MKLRNYLAQTALSSLPPPTIVASFGVAAANPLLPQHPNPHHLPTTQLKPNPTHHTPPTPLPHPPLFVSIAVPLPTFRGLPGECPVSHLTLFARLFPSPDRISRNFANTLLNDAALWHELTIQPHSISWEDTKSAFIRAFRTPEYSYHLRIRILYRYAMQWIMKRWAGHGLPESLVRGLLVDGLRGEFHDWVAAKKGGDGGGGGGGCNGAEAARGAKATSCGFYEGRDGKSESEERREKCCKYWKKSITISMLEASLLEQYGRSASDVTVRNVSEDDAAASAAVVEATMTRAGACTVERIGGMMMAVGVFFLNILILCT